MRFLKASFYGAVGLALLALVVNPTVQAQVSSTVQYIEDLAATASSIGPAILCIRDDNASGATSADNDWANCITDSVNRIWTRPAWLTSTGSSMEDDTNDALRVSPVTVVTVQGKTQTAVREVVVTDTDGAQDGLLLLDGAGIKIRVSYAAFACDNANTVDVTMRLGFDTDTTECTAVSTGCAGFILSHPGVAPGSGISSNYNTVVEGATGDDLRLWMDDPVTGSCALVFAYESIS